MAVIDVAELRRLDVVAKEARLLEYGREIDRLRAALQAILGQEISGYQGACIIARKALGIDQQ